MSKYEAKHVTIGLDSCWAGAEGVIRITSRDGGTWHAWSFSGDGSVTLRFSALDGILIVEKLEKQ